MCGPKHPHICLLSFIPCNHISLLFRFVVSLSVHHQSIPRWKQSVAFYAQNSQVVFASAVRRLTVECAYEDGCSSGRTSSVIMWVGSGRRTYCPGSVIFATSVLICSGVVEAASVSYHFAEYKFINSDIDHLGPRVLKEERRVIWVVSVQPWIYVGGGKERESVAPNTLTPGSSRILCMSQKGTTPV